MGRKYTAILKDNTYRAKFYNVEVNKFPNVMGMIEALAKEGWKNIIASSRHNYEGLWSVTFVASK